MKKRFNNKGFSLLELIITIFLVFILFSVAYTILSIGNNNFTRGTAKTHLQQNARILDEYIQTYLRKATNIVVSANEGDKLEYTIEIEDNVANVNSDGLTADVIDEIQIRVDESGDKPILEYIIETSTGEETYQLTNSIVLNNMAPDYFAGNFSSFTALGSMALTYSSDMIVLLDRSLSVNPDDVEKSISYTGDDYLLFTFTLEGDNFVTGLDAMDATLSGGLSDLDVLDFSWSNDTLAKIQLGNGEVSDVIGTGSITIAEDAFEVGGELTVEVNIVEIASIVVSGLSQVSVPDVGEDPIDYTYTSSSFTAEAEEVGCGEVTWSLSDDTLAGVSIDSETGILTITDAAEAGSVNVVAELNS
ncbi:MAG: prepilin-type N-terminal cleavage/methylation domain-containing protein, partial [Clostridia bacterium]|nr:prepilin-type N-terminal cleavage/methylation domain-containing protein [Clostridia bacterium]